MKLGIRVFRALGLIGTVLALSLSAHVGAAEVGGVKPVDAQLKLLMLGEKPDAGAHGDNT